MMPFPLIPAAPFPFLNTKNVLLPSFLKLSRLEKLT